MTIWRKGKFSWMHFYCLFDFLLFKDQRRRFTHHKPFVNRHLCGERKWPSHRVGAMNEMCQCIGWTSVNVDHSSIAMMVLASVLSHPCKSNTRKNCERNRLTGEYYESNVPFSVPLFVRFTHWNWRTAFYCECCENIKFQWENGVVFPDIVVGIFCSLNSYKQ